MKNHDHEAVISRPNPLYRLIPLNVIFIALFIATPVLAQPNTIVFDTPGTQSWSVPNGVTWISIEAWGGGGSGGSDGGEGGGGGAYAQSENVIVSPGDSLEITVGSGGVPAGAGADTLVISDSVQLILAAGGSTGINGGAGGLAVNSIGTTRISGCSGGAGGGNSGGGGGGSPSISIACSNGSDRSGNTGGAGGNGIGAGGKGGNGPPNRQPGDPGLSPGGGGGGGGQSNTGGAGAAGRISISYYQPLAYYRFDEAGWSGTPSEVIDQTSVYHGTPQGGLNTAFINPAIPDSPGTCRYGDFDGQDDYIALPEFPNLTGSFTISAWIRPNTPSGAQNDWRIFADDQSNSGGYAFSLHDGGTGRLRFFSRNVNPVILDTGPIVPANTWSFVTVVHDASLKKRQIYLNGILRVEGTYTGSWGTDNGLASIGGEVSGTSESTSRWRFSGSIDEVSVFDSALLSSHINLLMAKTRICSDAIVDIDHFRFHHDGEGLTCSPETMRIQACLDSDCTAEAADPVSASLLPSGWAGGDNLVLNSNDELLLHYTTAGTATLGVSSSTPSALQSARCYIGGVLQPNCNITFHDSGFVFDVSDHTADSTETVTIRAVRKDDDSQQCVPGFQNETKSVSFWFDYLDPNAGTLAVNIDGTAISDTSPGTSFDLDFDNNGESQFDLRYPDVGLMRLNARHDGSGDSAGLVMTGLDQFITKPAYFTLDIPGNPGTATDASGAIFLSAGTDFPITVSARNASGDITPNYGRETTPESVLLTSLLVAPVAPVGGNLPDIEGTFGSFGEDCDGNPAAAGTACGLFNWPEVGIIQLRPSVLDGDYLGAGDVVGTISNNVGRFIPDRFDVTHTVSPACNAIFIYAGLDAPSNKVGQPFSVSGTVIALNTAGSTTTYYEGGFAKLGTDGISALPKVDTVAANGTLTWSVDTLNFIDGVGDFDVDAAQYAFNSASSPQNMHLQITATDSDGVTGSEDDPVKATDYRLGRLRIQNTHGSELIKLSAPIFTEYLSSGGYFTKNTDDSCTELDLATHFDFTPHGLTTIYGPDNPTFVSGESALTFSAPGAGNTGYVDVESVLVNAPSLVTDLPWLLYDWNNDGVHDNEATGRATFGIYQGSDRMIYMRERY